MRWGSTSAAYCCFFTHTAYLTTFSHHIAGVDILAMAGSLQKRPRAGFGLATDIRGLDLKSKPSNFKTRLRSAPAGET